jgi:hypothetical protein
MSVFGAKWHFFCLSVLKVAPTFRPFSGVWTLTFRSSYGTCPHFPNHLSGFHPPTLFSPCSQLILYFPVHSSSLPPPHALSGTLRDYTSDSILNYYLYLLHFVVKMSSDSNEHFNIRGLWKKFYHQSDYLSFAKKEVLVTVYLLSNYFFVHAC